ncbi:Mov34/MPN/PAD-1 family protein (plasmid) [Arthrobacter sp. FW305-BF8]|uniref:Mov34/MPN/PAD-1 family protein n=1 Tax=Arthrobacter sp. FW305-BF8 TaxID=2879617 RepID=UPI001F1A66EE|nr:Mov34/MPN/PAD-1 family protein [Arthrobacter sp. FW305-BF8]UKA56657.1 Mov34/MPN/PAD-1 family protein [Arthrobacter sp. FW305-BF8]
MSNPVQRPDVRIIPKALMMIGEEAIRSRDGLETGGILLGTDDGQEIVIRHAGGPGPKARREFHRFLRDLSHAQQLAELAWREDQSQWIGEWHTHPSGDVTPSNYDLEAYAQHLHDPELGFKRFLTIIVGITRTDEITAVAWIVDQETALPVPVAVGDDREGTPAPQSPADKDRK